MRILLLNPSDTKGGSAQVAWNLAKGLRQRGHDVEFWVTRKSSSAEFVRELPDVSTKKESEFGKKVIHRMGINELCLQSPMPRQAFLAKQPAFDLIHLHDLGNFNWRDFSWLAQQAPLVWTIHSMAPFTGNCLYSYGCERFRDACGNCPQIGNWHLEWLHRDGSALNVRLKRWFLSRVQIDLIGVSDWIRDRCLESRLFRDFPANTIANAVDPERFYTVDQAQARSRLGVPQDARAVLLSVSGNPRDTRKGLDLAIAALRELKDFSLFLIPLGIAGDSPELRETLAQFPGLPPRHVDDDAVLRDCYAAADVVWHPSRADTSSMVSLEAFACGTPVIAAAVGGVPEVVTPEYGLRIPAEDASALVAATRRFFTEPELRLSFLENLANRKTDCLYQRFLDQHEELYCRRLAQPMAHS